MLVIEEDSVPGVTGARRRDEPCSGFWGSHAKWDTPTCWREAGAVETFADMRHC